MKQYNSVRIGLLPSVGILLVAASECATAQLLHLTTKYSELFLEGCTLHDSYIMYPARSASAELETPFNTSEGVAFAVASHVTVAEWNCTQMATFKLDSKAISERDESNKLMHPFPGTITMYWFVLACALAVGLLVGVSFSWGYTSAKCEAVTDWKVQSDKFNPLLINSVHPNEPMKQSGSSTCISEVPRECKVLGAPEPSDTWHFSETVRPGSGTSSQNISLSSDPVRIPSEKIRSRSPGPIIEASSCFPLKLAPRLPSP